MALTISSDTEQTNKLNNSSTNVNKKYLASTDKEDSPDTKNVNVHNAIRDKLVEFTSNGKSMNSSYFKSTLACVYSDIYQKSMALKNLPDDSEMQANVIKIKTSVSYYKVYEILKYYSNDSGKNMLNDDNLVNVTAMFYVTLNSFIKRQFTL